ncbi:hypothetical protein BDB00DRAFT_926537 [Zychaea mexicana]|uniref:uncharacterized protein n=1 Tax=Zychaea mexicana TaxID=64656 RepID=UPI0022FE1708|nr:uncharacterized protein BDB00DRAFT_926537 [Zychaea mexicana]KAI9496645.1 hypothetical protein BDB00DRAFT_926537 [Zychaea mexicana]
MVAGDWYEYHENSVDDEGRTSDDSPYQVHHQEDDIKEYELPPSATATTPTANTDGTNATTGTAINGAAASPTSINGFHDANSDGYDGHIDVFSSSESKTADRQCSSSSFFARLTSIPLVQDGISSANKVVQQHALGRFAGRTLSTLVAKTQTYIPTDEQSRLYGHLERANALGNMSLDLVESQFPLMMHATSNDLRHAPNLMAGEIRGRIGTAINRFRAPADAATNDVSRRMAQVMDNVEAVLDQYFPTDEEGEKLQQRQQQQQQMQEDELIDPQDGQRLDDGEGGTEQDIHSYNQLLRMYRIANSLSIRIARRIAIQLDKSKSVSKDSNGTENVELSQQQQQEQAAAIMKLRGWLLTQTQQLVEHLDIYKSQLPEPVQAHVVQPFIQIAQKEYEILRQEIDRTDISHIQRARNMLVLSQDMVIMPLLQQSVESMRSHVVSYRTMAQQNRAQVMNELSVKVPFLASIAPMSAFASHHFSSKKPTETEGKKKLNGVHPPDEDMMKTPAAAAEAC